MITRLRGSGGRAGLRPVPAFQAGHAGSIPVTRSTVFADQRPLSEIFE
jgi:hypothetical protein